MGLGLRNPPHPAQSSTSTPLATRHRGLFTAGPIWQGCWAEKRQGQGVGGKLFVPRGRYRVRSQLPLEY